MKQKIIELVKNKTDLSLTAFKSHLPEIEGDLEYHFPAKGVEATNILLIANVNQEFIDGIHDLINAQILTFQPCDFYIVTYDGGEVYDLPLVKKNQLQYKELHWLPILIKKGPNFPA